MTLFPSRFLSTTSFPFSSCKVNSGALSLTFMQISPEESTARAGYGRISKPGPPMFLRILHRRILSCCALALALLAAAALVPLATAQEERPQIIPGERKPTQKKDAGPRAIAVVQMTANGKASLVPIAILINNKFWDASAYKADPVPMALDTGTVYEAEQSGSSLGLFTVNGALHSNAVNSQAPWIATGLWHPNGMEEPTKPAHADAAPVGIDTEDKPPRLTHNPASTPPTANPAPNSSSSPKSTNSQTSGASKPSGSSNSDEPPRLTKPASSSAPANPAPADAGSSSTPAKAGGSQPGSGAPSPPGDTKSKDSKADARPEEAKVPTSDSGTSEANRPRLRRGKPAESFADEEVPGYTKLGGAPAAAPPEGKVVQTAATMADVKLIPAISDAGGPAPKSFAFEWLKGEEDDRRKQMTQAAKEQVRAYVSALEKNRISAKPVPKTARRTPPPEPILESVQMVAYDLWNSNQAIIILTADAHMPEPPAGTAHSEVDTERQYSVTLVAYPDIYGNLRKLYSGVTDKFHLDVTPELHLIDAVDADGDGRGELLFRETSDQGTGWVIYRATADKLWKMYDSLNPQ